ncbi:2-oxoacid dehydrogenases acyltransferase-domain-containing protein [Pelagophyceae sp. CCMP2097]|nr:2-oxoacid dehydrogenases acyltransferase-domain-containing protein [Pelagophyceae sp. CCMP2097]
MKRAVALARAHARFALGRRLLPRSLHTTPHWRSAVPRSAPASASLVNFALADIGEGIAEVELMEWHVSVGSVVQQFDAVCTVQSDKATVEITSRFDGVVAMVHHAAGAMVQVGATLVSIQPHGSPAADATAAPLDGAAAPLAAAPAVPADVRHKKLATPAVRKLVKEGGIDLGAVDGTGPGGRVLKGDVLAFFATPPPRRSDHNGHEPTVAPPGPGPSRGGSAEAPGVPADELPRAATAQPLGEEVPIRGVRQAMFRAMGASLAVPHFVFCDEYRMDVLMAAQRALGCSALPLLLKAASLALRDFPIVNASVCGTPERPAVRFNALHNFGFAVDTPAGLVVPVVRDVATKSVSEIVDELRRLRDAALAERLSPSDVAGATLTLSNIGSVGGTYMSPVVALPQVAIGAIGRARRVPVFETEESDRVVAAHVAAVSWGADHRVIDGATMARFSNRVKELVQNPLAFLQHLR